MNKQLAFRALVLLAVLSVLIAGGLLLFDFFKTQQKFPPNFFIGAIDVSGLSANDAIDKLNKQPIEALLPQSITFTLSKESLSYAPRDLGVYVLANDTVSGAFSMTHNDKYFSSLKTRLTKGSLSYPPKFSFIKENAKEIAADIARQINSAPMDARIDLLEETGGYHIYPDKPGRIVLANETIANLRTALENGQTTVPIAAQITDQPKITEQMLRKNPPAHRIAAFTTYYGSHDSPNRIHNIKLIASWLNNTLLMPDEEFSATDRIGEFTEERGFKEAFVIMNNELVPQLGGGTCQIGTTLYNAVSLADLKILSRRNHSFYFNIYPLGRDATIYPGSADLKFQNDSGYPLLIKAIATNKKLSFRIYGTPTGKTVTFSPPEIMLLGEDGVFRPATLRQVIATDRPFRTIITRTVKDKDGNEIKTEILRSFYKLYGEKSNVPIARPEAR